jgi:serine acetyltransferase/acyl carrier protein
LIRQVTDIVADLHDSIRRLTVDQRVELEARLQDRRNEAVSKNLTTPRADKEAWPLSAAQMRMWQLNRRRPDDPLYNVQRAWRLEGVLDVAALEASLTDVVERHETLRARFVDEGGSPFQEVRRSVLLALPIASAPAGDADPQKWARTTALEDAERPFDLQNELLIRPRLLRLGSDDHVLVLTIHHIVCDGWSLDVIERDLSEIYNSRRRVVEPSLDPLLIQYADYAAWQAGDDQKPAVRRDIEYWSKRLQDPVAKLQLSPNSHHRHPTAPQGARLQTWLDEELTGTLKDTSRAMKVTPFIILLTAFQLALHQGTGQRDIVLCSPTAGRTQLATENLVGYFNNLVVLRGDLSGDPTVVELLKRNHTDVVEAFDHQEAAFQDVAALPNVVTVPLARGMFVLQEQTKHPLRLTDISVTSFAVESETADFDLAVFMREVDGRYRSEVRFRPNAVTQDEIGLLMARFEATTRGIIEAPEAAVSSIASSAPGTPAETATGARGSTASAVDPNSAEPLSPTESRLAQIWERVFQMSPIDANDDFFDLGGHSLLAVELMGQIEAEFDLDSLPLSILLEAPTVALMSSRLESGLNRNDPEPLGLAVPLPDEAPRLPLHKRGAKALRGFFVRLIQVLALYAPGAKTTRVWLHRLRGVRIGKDSFIGTSVILETSRPELVTIGSRVTIGIRAVVIAHFYDALGVEIADDVFIGPGVIIMPNTRIGYGAVVAGGSVVTKSVPELTVVRGNPAEPVAHSTVPLSGATSRLEFMRGLQPIRKGESISL